MSFALPEMGTEIRNIEYAAPKELEAVSEYPYTRPHQISITPPCEENPLAMVHFGYSAVKKDYAAFSFMVQLTEPSKDYDISKADGAPVIEIYQPVRRILSLEEQDALAEWDSLNSGNAKSKRAGMTMLKPVMRKKIKREFMKEREDSGGKSLWYLAYASVDGIPCEGNEGALQNPSPCFLDFDSTTQNLTILEATKRGKLIFKASLV